MACAAGIGVSRGGDAQRAARGNRFAQQAHQRGADARVGDARGCEQKFHGYFLGRFKYKTVKVLGKKYKQRLGRNRFLLCGLIGGLRCRRGAGVKQRSCL